MDKPIIFNEKEAQALVDLINIAVKSAGLQVSEAAVILVGKIQKAFAPIEKATVPQETEEAGKEKGVEIASMEEIKQPESSEVEPKVEQSDVVEVPVEESTEQPAA